MHCSLEVVQQFDGKAVRESEELRREADGLSAGRKKIELSFSGGAARGWDGATFAADGSSWDRGRGIFGAGESKINLTANGAASFRGGVVGIFSGRVSSGGEGDC